MRPQNTRNQKENKIKEEYAIILDVILDNSNNFKSNDVVQAIGTKTYVLLELSLKQDVTLSTGDKVYIGDGKRDEIQYIKRALFFDKLTPTASSELIFTIQDIVEEREEEYVNFLNNCGPITIRQHALEMIPGIGKKHLKDLLEERYKPFKDFKDVKERCSFLADPSKSFSQRILAEIQGETEYRFFTKRE